MFVQHTAEELAFVLFERLKLQTNSIAFEFQTAAKRAAKRVGGQSGTRLRTPVCTA